MPNPAEVPLYFLAQNARKYVKVVLSGEGADELFGGYPMYCQAVHFEGLRAAKVPAPLRQGLCPAPSPPNGPGVQGQALPGPRRQAALAAVSCAPTMCSRLAGRPRPVPEKGLPQPTAPEEPTSSPTFDKVAGLDEPTQLQWVDMHTWMLYDILLKADRMSMANSSGAARALPGPRDARAGAVHPPALPQRRGAHQDRPARRGAASQLPDSVAKRRKLGFPVPLNDWLRQDKYYAMVREKFEGPVARQFFNVPAICRLLEDHKAGRAKNMTKIWSIYSFILWYELYFVNAAPPAGVYNRAG